MSNSRFHQLWAQGYKHLLPIIPPDAQMSPNSKIKDSAKGKTPGRLNQNAEWGGFDWINFETTEAHLNEWAATPAGVGVRCMDLVAIDIDVLREDLADIVQRVALDTLGRSTRRIGRWPKRLLVYRMPRPDSRQLFFRDDKDTEHLVEILGHHKQFVINGIHPDTGKPYEWSKPLWDVPYDRLTEVTPEQIDAFFEAVIEALELMDCDGFRRSRTSTSTADRSTIDQQRLTAPDMATLSAVVDAIPNSTDFERRDQYIRMGCAIKAAGGDDAEAFDVFWSWCSRWAGGDNDIDEVESDWRRMHAPFEVGFPWLVTLAQKAGYSVAESDFGEAEDVPATANTAAEDDFGAEDETDTPPNWWNSYVYVNELKRFIDTQRGLRLDKEQFRDLHPHVETEHGDAVKTFLAVRTAGRFADRVTYRPGNKSVLLTEDRGVTAFNTWSPGPIHAGLWDDIAACTEDSPWHQLLRHLLPNDYERELLIKWFASLLQRPGVKPNWHPLIGGDQGIGKDSLLAPIVAALGRNARSISATDLERDTNPWADQVQLVIVQEMHNFERRSVQNRLKIYQAAPPEEIPINIKYVPEYWIPNVLGMVMMTNNRDAYALEKSDRRIFVLWSDAAPLDEALATRLYKWYANGGTAQVARYLMDLDLAGFDTQGRAPFTEAKEEMRMASAHPVEAMVADSIENEVGPFSKDLATLEEIRDWLRQELGQRQAMSPQYLSARLKMCDVVYLGRSRVPGLPGRHRIYCARRQDTYQDLITRDPGAFRAMAGKLLAPDDFDESQTTGKRKGA
jgi:hypothetical protein